MIRHRQTTIKMIEHKFEGDIEIYPLGDLHLGSRECNVPAIKATIEHILSKPNRYVVLTGDLTDNATKSSKGSVYEATMNPSEQIDYAIETLRPLKDVVLAIVPGNHEARVTREVSISPSNMIARGLGLSHLWRPDVAFVYIDLGEGGGAYRGRRRPKYSVAVAHGVSNGTTPGAGLNRGKPYLRAMGVDLLLTGHTHQPTVGSFVRYEPNASNRVMIPKESKIVTGTGWLGYGGYGSEKMFDPLPIAVNKAILSSEEHHIAVMQY